MCYLLMKRCTVYFFNTKRWPSAPLPILPNFSYTEGKIRTPPHAHHYPRPSFHRIIIVKRERFRNQLVFSTVVILRLFNPRSAPCSRRQLTALIRPQLEALCSEVYPCTIYKLAFVADPTETWYQILKNSRFSQIYRLLWRVEIYL